MSAYDFAIWSCVRASLYPEGVYQISRENVSPFDVRNARRHRPQFRHPCAPLRTGRRSIERRKDQGARTHISPRPRWQFVPPGFRKVGGLGLYAQHFSLLLADTKRKTIKQERKRRRKKEPCCVIRLPTNVEQWIAAPRPRLCAPLSLSHQASSAVGSHRCFCPANRHFCKALRKSQASLPPLLRIPSLIHRSQLF